MTTKNNTLYSIDAEKKFVTDLRWCLGRTYDTEKGKTLYLETHPKLPPYNESIIADFIERTIPRFCEDVDCKFPRITAPPYSDRYKIFLSYSEHEKQVFLRTILDFKLELPFLSKWQPYLISIEFFHYRYDFGNMHGNKMDNQIDVATTAIFRKFRRRKVFSIGGKITGPMYNENTHKHHETGYVNDIRYISYNKYENFYFDFRNEMEKYIEVFKEVEK